MTSSAFSMTTECVDKEPDGTSTSGIGLITLDTKPAGKPSAGKQHAGFDAAGAGNQLTVRIMRHSLNGNGETRLG